MSAIMKFNWVQIASILMFFAVGFGAFGAHALKAKLNDYSLDVYKTAVLYHFVHAVALFIVAWLASQNADPKINLAGVFFTLGIVLFSGSLYLIAITTIKKIGIITPFGGLAFLTGWILLAISKTNL